MIDFIEFNQSHESCLASVFLFFFQGIEGKENESCLASVFQKRNESSVLLFNQVQFVNSFP